MELIAALSLGLLGSLHCVGMCGPLVLAVPSNATSRWKFLGERIIYNLGRAITYGIMGMVLGFAGKSIMIDVQQEISIFLGVSILLTVAIPFAIRSKIEKYSPLKYLYSFVKEKFSTLMRKRGMTTLFTMGMLNGLLPCGLVYTSLLGATVVADMWQSALFMIVFGVGTAPALIAVSLAGKLVSLRFRSFMNRALPVFSIVIALILILRGMNLGIPMISPKSTNQQNHSQPTAEQDSMDCCKD